MNDPIVVTRTLIKRAWADVEPKVQWAFASGAAASFLLELAKAYGVTLPPILVQELPFGLAVLAGYIMPSVGQTVTTTKVTPAGRVQEQEAHTGNAVSVFTAPTPIQPPAPTAVAPSFTDIVEQTPAAEDAKPTEIISGTTLPDSSRGAAFWAARGQNSTQPQSIDGH